MQPIKQSLREVLVAVHNGHSSADAIAREIGVARSTVIERLRNLRESSHVSAFNNSYQTTDKGIETILHAPVVKKGEQVTAYSQAKPGGAYKVKFVPYEGRELMVNPGITDDRLEAFKLGSRMGDKVYFPDGRVENV